MKVGILGSGLVGSALGARLLAFGHHVTGTTTRSERIDVIGDCFSEVRVLRGSDRASVAGLVDGCDAVIVTVGPSAAQAMTREDRAASYHDVLVATAESVCAAASTAQLVMLSALTVYGDAADADGLVTESFSLTTSDDPSPSMFQAAESVYRDTAPDRSCIFRCADIWGAHDPPIADKVRFAHDILKGSVPFQAEALFYRVHTDDVVNAVLHAVDGRLVGTFNLASSEVPLTNATLFDAISSDLGYAPLEYRGEIRGPSVPVSVAALDAAGFRCAPADSHGPQ